MGITKKKVQRKIELESAILRINMKAISNGQFIEVMVIRYLYC